jgi:HEAT repeat protein
MNRWMLGLFAAVTLATSDLRVAGTWFAQGDTFAVEAAAAWLSDDPADSLYRLAREALNRGQYRRASDLFAELVRRHPRSGYAGDALYWQAFSLYREGGSQNLRSALRRLETQKASYPGAATRGDADALATRIRGALAGQGDPEAAERVLLQAESAVVQPPQPPRPPQPPQPPVPPTPPTPPTPPGLSADRAECDDDADIKLAALNAVLQMDAERAMPLLTKVLARRDGGSVCLRRKAVFLVAQKRTPETEATLLGAIRNDPDPEVREQAVFWLSQVQGPRVVAILDSIIQRCGDPDLRDKAVFALSQQRDPRATEALRGIAERREHPRDLREKAIFWLGQSKGSGGAYLKGLYDRLDDDELKKKVIFAVSQGGGPENTAWLLGLARDTRNSVEVRKSAIFWASQHRATAAELGALYGSLKEPELKEQTIFALSQVKDAGAFDQLATIARRDADPEMRKKALFWIGQSKDPRAADLLEQMLNE